MTELREFTDFAAGPLIFPYKGRTYTAPEVSIAMGLRLNGILNEGESPDLSTAELWPELLGSMWDEMVADGVPMVFASRVAATVMADFQFGREYATVMWETGGDPKALAEYMRRKSAPNRASRRSNSTGGARKTR